MSIRKDTIDKDLPSGETAPNPYIYQGNNFRTMERIQDERMYRVGDKIEKSEYKPAYADIKTGSHTYRSEAIRGIHDKSLLNTLYFSKANIKKVQNKLRYTIFKLAQDKFVIGEQQEITLLIVMRSIYLQYSRNLRTNIKEQIAVLNQNVVDELAPKVLSNTKQYYRYLEDANEPWKPIERQQATSNKGTRQLRLDTALGFGKTDKQLIR